MMINLDKIIKGFISGTIEINDVIEKYDISYFLLVKLIKNYCYSNKISITEDISYRLNTPIRKMLDLIRHGMSYKELAEKYNCSSYTILKRLTEYCEQNNLEISKVKITLPMEEIYKLKSQGMLYKELAEKYNCSYTTIRRRLTEYEDELILRNKYLEILLYDFNKIIDNVLNKTIRSFYDDKVNQKQDDYSFIKK